MQDKKSKKAEEKSALNVQGGIDQPDSINYEALKRFKKRAQNTLRPEEYIEGIRKGDRTLLSRSITLVESSLTAHHELAQQIIEGCLPFSGNSLRVGITGVPGVGKSTFIEAMGKHLTNNGHKLAVLAIDPSSTRTKGSILGDKTRMEELCQDINAFIRPSPSAGSLGGVARKTRESIILCEAAGYDVIFIETVGVGQSEIAVHGMVDFFLLLMLAGAGDELQGIKRGIMEMADAIIINKADGDNVNQAMLAKKQYENALHLYPPTASGWTPKVLTCSAAQKKGMEESWGVIEDYKKYTLKNGYFQLRRNEQNRNTMYDHIHALLENHFFEDVHIKEELKLMETRIKSSRHTPYQAAQKMMDLWMSNIRKSED